MRSLFRAHVMTSRSIEVWCKMAALRVVLVFAVLVKAAETAMESKKSYREKYTPTGVVRQEREDYEDYEKCVYEKSKQFVKGKERAWLVMVEEGDTATLRCKIW